MPSHIVPPHGGRLTELIVDAERATELRSLSRDCPSWDLTPRQLCDLELLLSGGFSPLAGFLCRRDYEGVCRDMRLADGTLWPIPVALDVPEETAKGLAERDQCRKLLGESENSAIDPMDRIVQLCVEAKTAEAGAVNAYLEADKELGAAKAGEPARYAQYEADKADIAMAVANLTMERLSLQERLRLLATSITNLQMPLTPG